MKIIKSKNVQETLLNIVLVVGGVFLIGALLHYGSNKNLQKDMMVNGGNSEVPKNVVSPEENSGNKIEASNGSIFDPSFSSVSSEASQPSLSKQPVMNPNELLPKQQNSKRKISISEI